MSPSRILALSNLAYDFEAATIMTILDVYNTQFDLNQMNWLDDTTDVLVQRMGNTAQVFLRSS